MLCEIDLKFVPDQRTEKKSTFGIRDTKLLARLELCSDKCLGMPLHIR